jgi:hypothetical protein
MDTPVRPRRPRLDGATSRPAGLPPVTGGRVDRTPGTSLPYGAPVADWLGFLAELLATEFLRESGSQEARPS